MLSLTGKIASLYLNKFEDQAAIATVNEIENLTTGLSRKIWQKIMISQTLSPDDEESASPLDDRPSEGRYCRRRKNSSPN